MTHTNEFLRGMFAAYMGCEAYAKRSEGKYYLKGLDISNDILFVSQVSDHWDGNTGDIREYRPVLTPLSEITDEDALELSKLYYSNKDSHTIEMGRILIDHITTPHMARKVVWSIFDASAIIDCLRSKHYDLGYMHIPSLITAGLAISSTTTK